MPGTILAVQGTKIVGCAWHPRYRTYPVVVHAVVGSAIARSAVANERFEYGLLPKEGGEHGFILDLGPLEQPSATLARTRVLIAETDEWLDLPARGDRGDGEITVEEILDLPFRRRWVTGKIYFDALLAGLSIETVVDLSYRDYLGRRADAAGLALYAGCLRSGSLSYEDFRGVLLAAPEYVERERRAHEAPGAIFSRRIVLSARSELAADGEREPADESRVSARELLALGSIDFIAETHRELIGEPPPASLVWRHLDELRAGRQKLDILRELAADPRATRRNIRFFDPIEEEEAAFDLPPQGAGGGREGRGAVIAVSVADLLALDGAKFIEESWRCILGRMPSSDEAAYCELWLGNRQEKRKILEYLAGDREAMARNVRLAPAADSRAAPRRRRALRDSGQLHRPRVRDEFARPRTWPTGIETIAGGAAMIAGLRVAPAAFDPADESSGVIAKPAKSRNVAAAQVPLRRLPSAGYQPFGDRDVVDGPLVGAGFYAAETDGTNWWRWTGPGRQVQIRLPVAKPGGYRIAIWCERAAAAVLEGLLMRCSGEEARLQITRHAGSASIICEAWAPETGFVGWLDLELRHGPPERSADGRLLGLCIGSIALTE